MGTCIQTLIAHDAQVVQEGAALAPAWTEAMFHELLDQEASPASGAALHHAADIMSLYDTAKARHCMAGMQQSISGVQKHAAPFTYTCQLWQLHSGARTICFVLVLTQHLACSNTVQNPTLQCIHKIQTMHACVLCILVAIPLPYLLEDCAIFSWSLLTSVKPESRPMYSGVS